jgi:hypothetical protein
LLKSTTYSGEGTSRPLTFSRDDNRRIKTSINNLFQ